MVLNFARLNYDERPNLILRNANGDALGVLGYAYNTELELLYNETSTLQFDLPYSEGGTATPFYDDVVAMRIIDIPGFGQFTLIKPDETDDGVKRFKECKAYSLEYEFAYKKITLANDTYKFWDSDAETRGQTVLGMIMELMPSWSVSHVDEGLIDKYRTFEVSNENLYNFMKSTLQESYECIFEFDTVNRRVSVRDISSAVTEQPLYLSTRNTIKEVKIEQDVESIVTRLSVSGADGVDIRDVNPTGTNDIINLDYFMNTKNFPQALINKYYAWKQLCADSKETFYAKNIQYSAMVMQRATEQAKLTDLQGELTSLDNIRAVTIQAIAQGLADQTDLDEANANYSAKNAEVVEQQTLLDSIGVDIAAAMAELQQIVAACSYNSYFTEAERIMLDKYIKDGEVSESSFVVSENAVYNDRGTSAVLDGETILINDCDIDVVHTGSETIYDLKGGTMTIGNKLTGKVVTGVMTVNGDGKAVVTAKMDGGSLNGSSINGGNVSVSGVANTPVSAGGVNLLPGTATMMSGTGSTWGTSGSVTVTDGVATAAATETASWKSIGGHLKKMFKDYDGQRITVSCDIRAESNTDSYFTIEFRVVNSITSMTRVKYRTSGRFTPGNTWTRCSTTFLCSADAITSGDGTINPETDYLTVHVFRYGTEAGQIRHIMVETGETASDWTVAPEDVDPDAVVTPTAKHAMVNVDGTMYFTVNASEYDRRSVEWDLMEYGEDILARLSQPTYTFSVESANFLALSDFYTFRDALTLGQRVYLEIDGEALTPICIGVNIQLDDPSKLTLKFSDSYLSNDKSFRLVDLLEQSVSMGKTVSVGKFNYESFHNSGASSGIQEFMNNAWDVAKNAILSSSDQAISWDDAGLRLRQWANDSHTAYEDEQIWMNNNSVLMTDDGWQTAKMAIGKFVDEELGECWGILAPMIVGKLIAGSSLIIESSKREGGTSVFRVDGDGARMYNGDISVIGSARRVETDRCVKTGGVYVYAEDDATSDIVGRLNEDETIEITKFGRLETPNQWLYGTTAKGTAGWVQFNTTDFVNVSYANKATHVVMHPDLGLVVGVYPAINTDETTGTKSLNETNARFWVDNGGNVHIKGVLEGTVGKFSGIVNATELNIGGVSSDTVIGNIADGETDKAFEGMLSELTGVSSSVTPSAIVQEVSKYITAKHSFIAQPTRPTADQIKTIGDYWVDTSNEDSIVYRWNGSSWELYAAQSFEELVEQATQTTQRISGEGINMSVQASTMSNDISEALGGLNDVTENVKTMRSEVNLMADAIESKVSEDDLYSIVRQDVNGVHVGKSNSNFEATVSSEGFQVDYYDGDRATVNPKLVWQATGYGMRTREITFDIDIAASDVVRMVGTVTGGIAFV